MTRVNDFYITILDGYDRDLIVNLADFEKDKVTFGRNSENDIVLKSAIVSKWHGFFVFNGDSWQVYDNNSTNGITWNNARISSKRLMSGDKLLIGYETTGNKVAFMFSNRSPRNLYRKFNLTGKRQITIGRGHGSDIVLSHVAVFRTHCRIVADQNGYCLEQAVANAAVQYNGGDIRGRQLLQDMDRLLIGATQFIYQTGSLHYMRIAEGLSFDVSHLAKIVGRGSSEKYINHDVNFSVDAGEFVAIIGGSGAGKSTLLNCLCGCSKISEGSVTIAGEDLTANYSSLKHLIGYVPQKDIVYDNLTLESMLYYTAKLRMPDDSTAEEIEERIDKALSMVELTDRRDVFIKNLSGGQRKRASIAVELLSDPKLFFLDEPTSGLDPGTERNLMVTLKEMTRKGKTVVLVTHTPLNLHLCDKVVIMGAGGRLCYCGKPKGAEAFFGVDNLVDIYDLVNNASEKWAKKYSENMVRNPVQLVVSASNRKIQRTSSLRQLSILVSRYVSLQMNDMRRMGIQLLMAPGLGLLLYAAFKEGFPFAASHDTQKLALTMACCAFWLGLFNSIQEICKEGQIYQRERMANLKLMPYVGSKLVVHAMLDLIQTVLLLLVVGFLLGMPEQGKQLPNEPELEIFITTYLTMFSANCIGLMVSALVNNSDQAISIAPVLLIPQILFSGIIVDLEGIIDKISYVVSCRYACVAYCTTSDINNLPSEFTLTALGYEEGERTIISSLYSYTDNINYTVSDWFGEEFAQTFTNPIVGGWLALIAMSVIVTAATVLILKQKSKIK